MIPKTIHLCWFSGDPFPVEIKICLKSWERLLPDYQIKLWDYDMARAIGIDYINEALEERRWAFAADVVRFWAVWKEGGVYMDSDILLYHRFDNLLPENGFMTFFEKLSYRASYPLQAAFFAGSAGNSFCKKMVDYYSSLHYYKSDGTYNEIISPITMMVVAKDYGLKDEDVFQTCGDLIVYPTRLLAPLKRYPVCREAIGRHMVYGSWRKRKIGRRIEIYLHHLWHLFCYYVLRSY